MVGELLSIEETRSARVGSIPTITWEVTRSSPWSKIDGCYKVRTVQVQRNLKRFMGLTS